MALSQVGDKGEADEEMRLVIRRLAPDAPRGNAICRMVDASEIAFVTAFLASDKSWAISGELVVATGQLMQRAGQVEAFPQGIDQIAPIMVR